MPRLILASTSRYRRELLARLGVPFEARAPTGDEHAIAGERPATMAARLARAKAESVSADDAVIIGSDQVASLDDALLRKPGDRDRAVEQLRACQGRIVVFHTAVAVIETASGRRQEHVDRTEVRFTTLPSESIERYVELEQPFDCAGSFKAEGLGVALFERIDSSDPTALIGLPLIWLARALRNAGLDPLASTPSWPRAPSART